ncbi:MULTISPECIES: hypothetical protein, partial [unclassified Pseudomonas]|uniref:hypothetical protein n=1 Tax=unclassified Pseudomonas TaxID=196821 RepID=UPI001A92E354
MQRVKKGPEGLSRTVEKVRDTTPVARELALAGLRSSLKIGGSSIAKETLKKTSKSGEIRLSHELN